MSVPIIGHTQLGNAAYINYLGSLINNAICNRDIRIQDCHGNSSIQEYAFQQQTAF
jgi:hypothetical protein